MSLLPKSQGETGPLIANKSYTPPTTGPRQNKESIVGDLVPKLPGLLGGGHWRRR